MTPALLSVTMHGLRAEDGVYQRSAGAQSDPTWRHVPEGGAGGEQEELPEESSSSRGAGGVTEGETLNVKGLVTHSNDSGVVTQSDRPTGRTWSGEVSDRAAVQ